jgi:hypothetical protein
MIRFSSNGIMLYHSHPMATTIVCITYDIARTDGQMLHHAAERRMIALRLPQQLRQLRHVDRNPSSLFFREEFRRRSPMA